VTEVRTADRNAEAERLPDNLFEEPEGQSTSETKDEDVEGPEEEDVEEAMEEASRNSRDQQPDPRSIETVIGDLRYCVTTAIRRGVGAGKILATVRKAIRTETSR